MVNFTNFINFVLFENQYFLLIYNGAPNIGKFALLKTLRTLVLFLKVSSILKIEMSGIKEIHRVLSFSIILDILLNQISTLLVDIGHNRTLAKSNI